MTNLASQHLHTGNPAIYIGGSFDPVHYGHLFMAQRIEACLTALGVSADIQFLPTAGSPLKNTQTSTQNRVDMLQLALADTSYSLDLRETQQAPPVYSIDTLKKLRADYEAKGVPLTPLIFVMGLDSLASLPKWKDGMALLDYCHFWVFDRENDESRVSHTSKRKKNGEKIYHLSENLAQYAPEALRSAVTTHLEKLITHSHGYIFFDDVRPPTVSSSQIRCDITAAKKLVTSAVWEYIKTNKLYRTP